MPDAGTQYVQAYIISTVSATRSSYKPATTLAMQCQLYASYLEREYSPWYILHLLFSLPRLLFRPLVIGRTRRTACCRSLGTTRTCDLRCDSALCRGCAPTRAALGLLLPCQDSYGQSLVLSNFQH